MHAVVKTEKGRPRVLQVGLRNILNPTRSLRKALEIARKALKTATWKVDLELQDAHRDILAIYTLYERRLP